MTSSRFKYFAFISYSSMDTQWGKQLQCKLEHYRMPAMLCNEHGWDRTPIKPVFFAPTDIQPGGLTTELHERLHESKNLIVICSPHSAKSEWVGKEIEYFHHLGRTEHIHFFIVDGVPHSGTPATECFNPIVDRLGLPEILGANIHEKIYRWPWMNKERAYVQLITKLLGVDFDAIWQRHKRRFIQKVIAWFIGVVAVMSALFVVWMTSRPVDVEIRLNEASVHNSQLPPLQNAIITITLDNETKTDTICTFDDSVVFTNIPYHYINKKVRARFICQNFLDTDTTLLLTPRIVLNINRDPSVFGNVHFRLWYSDLEKPLAHSRVEVAGHEAISDENGHVTISFPLEQQRKAYYVSASRPLVKDTIHMPCGEDDLVLIR